MDEVSKLPEADQVFEIPISYEEKGKEIGKEIGVRKVAVEMLKKMLIPISLLRSHIWILTKL